MDRAPRHKTTPHESVVQEKLLNHLGRVEDVELLRQSLTIHNGFLSPAPKGSKRVYRFFQLAALSTLLSLIITFILRNGDSLSLWNRPLTGKRLIQFSPTHKEWIPSAAFDYLLSVRDAVSTKTAPPLTSMDLEEMRTQHHALEDVSDEAILSLTTREGFKVGYMDITEAYESGSLVQSSAFSDMGDSDMPSYSSVNATAHPEFQRLIDMVSAEELRNIVSELSTSFKTRYFRSGRARAPALWIQSYMSQHIINSTVSLFENSFDQPNVVARLSPPGTDDSRPTILLGGHLDSTSPLAYFRAPGADDDASGTAVMLHVMSILSKSGWIKEKAQYPIEGHAYAGEEGGLLGSQKMARAFKSAERSVRGILNLEMVGWQPEYKGSSTITVLDDPNIGMHDYMLKVIKEYIPSADVRSTTCGYGCSDHYSWSSLGYPVVCLASYGPNDENLNPNYHSTSDTVDKLNFERMADFARAALAWVIQVGCD